MAECKVEKYSLIGDMQGLSFNQTNGLLKVDTSVSGEPTDLTLSL